MSKNQVIIVAAGKGNRMGGEIPKQFLLLGGKPVLAYSLEAFRQFDPEISLLLVLPEDQIEAWEKLRTEHGINIPHQIVAGGATRFQSVANGLGAAADEGLVAVHDGVRPLVKPETIGKLFREAGKKGNAIPYSLPVDSVRIERKNTSVVIDRDSLRMIQTPQVFDTVMLKKAYQQKESPGFTDDATVFEKAGGKIHLVESPAGNIKITRPEDLLLASALLGQG